MLKLLAGDYGEGGNSSRGKNNYSNNNGLDMSGETVVVLLYNVLKILLGVDDVPEHVMAGLAGVFKQYNMPTPNNYNETIFRLFIIIKLVIFKQSYAMTNNSTTNTNTNNNNS